MNIVTLNEIKDLVKKIITKEIKFSNDYPDVGFLMVRLPFYINVDSFNSTVYSFLNKEFSFVHSLDRKIDPSFEFLGQEVVLITLHHMYLYIIGVGHDSAISKILNQTSHIHVVDCVE